GLIVVLIAPIFSKLIRFFPPVVTGTVVTIIGITLMPVAFNDLAGGQGAEDFGAPVNLLLGFSNLIIILLILKFAKVFLNTNDILFYIVCVSIHSYFFNIYLFFLI